MNTHTSSTETHWTTVTSSTTVDLQPRTPHTESATSPTYVTDSPRITDTAKLAMDCDLALFIGHIPSDGDVVFVSLGVKVFGR